MKRTVFTWGLMLLVCASGLLAQGADEPGNEEQNVDMYITLLRQDVQSQAMAIIGQMMQFTPEQASVFWPVYAEYSKELQQVGDKRIANIKDYAQNYGNLEDQKAQQLIMRALDFQVKRLELKRAYFPKFAQALSPKLAAKFFQVEHQLHLIIDLQLASSLPVVE